MQTPSTSLAGFLLRPYELRVYWFEIVECVRKVALVGIPVFFVNDCLRPDPNPRSRQGRNARGPRESRGFELRLQQRSSN